MNADATDGGWMVRARGEARERWITSVVDVSSREVGAGSSRARGTEGGHRRVATDPRDGVKPVT